MEIKSEPDYEDIPVTFIDFETASGSLTNLTLTDATDTYTLKGMTIKGRITSPPETFGAKMVRYSIRKTILRRLVTETKSAPLEGK